MGNIRKKLTILGLTGVLSIVGRCEGNVRARLGCYATSTPGTRFISFEELGHHSYSHGFGEGNGIVYTCSGGHIDIVHVRLGADYTKNVREKAYNCIIKGKEGFNFKLQVEPTVHHIQIFYPSYWSSLPEIEKEKTAGEVSLKLAPYAAFSATTWHEMLTWYGFKCMGFVPEDASGFSWEDNYSNLLGCLLAVEAMKDTQHSYDEAMTIALKKEMRKLGIRSSRLARMASEKMRGKWFTGNLWVTMKKRNFDIGSDDGFVSPTLVPGLKDCSAEGPISYPAPNLDFLSDYGFSIKYEIEPHEFEKGKLLKIVYPKGKGKKIEPEKHFPILIKQIEKEALARGYSSSTDKGFRNVKTLKLKLSALNVADIYIRGEGAARNLCKAIYWPEQAEKSGGNDAKSTVATMYLTGKLIKPDHAKAFRMFREAAKSGHVYSQYMVGCMYNEGIYVEQSSEEANNWFIRAAQQDNPTSQYCLGKNLIEQRENTNAITEGLMWLKESAGQDCTEAQILLGIIYINGEILDEDFAEAYRYLSSAANKGSALAQHNLAVMYEEGLYVEKNLQETFQLYLKAAEQNYPDSLLNLGICYMEGFGVAKILYKARSCFEAAGKSGSADGFLNLGLTYVTRGSTRSDYVKSLKWFYLAQKLDCNDASELIGALENGLSQNGTSSAKSQANAYYNRLLRSNR
jgi:TPR repeat protein